MEVYITLRKDMDELKSMKLETVREFILCAILVWQPYCKTYLAKKVLTKPQDREIFRCWAWVCFHQVDYRISPGCLYWICCCPFLYASVHNIGFLLCLWPFQFQLFKRSKNIPSTCAFFPFLISVYFKKKHSATLKSSLGYEFSWSRD